MHEAGSLLEGGSGSYAIVRSERQPGQGGGQRNRIDRRSDLSGSMGVNPMILTGINSGIILCQIEYHSIQGGEYIHSGYFRWCSISIPLSVDMSHCVCAMS